MAVDLGVRDGCTMVGILAAPGAHFLIVGTDSWRLSFEKESLLLPFEAASIPREARQRHSSGVGA